MNTEEEVEMTEEEKETARRMLVFHAVGESSIGILACVNMQIAMVYRDPDTEFWKKIWQGVDFWDVVQGMVVDNLIAISGQTLALGGSEKTVLEKFTGLFRRTDDSLDSFLIVLHKTSDGMEFIDDVERGTLSVPAYASIMEKILRCRRCAE